MTIRVEITSSAYRGGKSIRVSSGHPHDMGAVYVTETIVSPAMSYGIRFDDMVDNLVKSHCRQKADAEFYAWKEGR